MLHTTRHLCIPLICPCAWQCMSVFILKSRHPWEREIFAKYDTISPLILDSVRQRGKQAKPPFLFFAETFVFLRSSPLAWDKVATLAEFSAYPLSVSRWMTLVRQACNICWHDFLIALVTKKKTKPLFTAVGWQLETGRIGLGELFPCCQPRPPTDGRRRFKNWNTFSSGSSKVEVNSEQVQSKASFTIWAQSSAVEQITTSSMYLTVKRYSPPHDSICFTVQVTQNDVSERWANRIAGTNYIYLCEQRPLVFNDIEQQTEASNSIKWSAEQPEHGWKLTRSIWTNSPNLRSKIYFWME